MNTLLKILRAAHCRSTHHFFAVDALPLVQTGPGKRLVGWLLRHHGRYLTGAKDPDTRFRDFQNHVIHVNDGYWGGAPRVAHQWYDRLQRYLRQERMGDAAHAAGVLSHYFTDPIMPLHTAQSDRESVLHRPIEWSITRSYETIYRQWKDDHMRVVFQMADGDGWLGEAILHAARFSNRKYERLMTDYRLDRGVKDPPAGLTPAARSEIAELFGLAITGWARVIERAARDVEANRSHPLPVTGLSLPTLLATIRVPDRWWLRRIESIAEQREVRNIVDEFRRTGKLVENLPAEIDIKRRVIQIHHDERRYREQRRRQANSPDTVIEVTHQEPSVASSGVAASHASANGPALPPTGEPANPFAAAIRRADDPERLPKPGTRVQDSGSHQSTSPRSTTGAVSPPGVPPSSSRSFRPHRGLKFRLCDADDLVDAPSIGPKTAKRFTGIGVETVEDFLRVDADRAAARLATRWITPEKIRDWQAQARLMCSIPAMLARDTQVLVGGGYTTAAEIAHADLGVIYDRIKRFTKTNEGRRYLRRSPAPSVDEVRGYQSNARAALDAASPGRALTHGSEPLRTTGADREPGARPTPRARTA